ncbi:MAG: glycosyltransferase [Candidatus Aminicenantales bacterium]|jgi:peptidoglycan/xylan/chitin deacetylase (PgdA/CDA1 family)
MNDADSCGESVKISVVVPARNEEQLLPSCLESLKHQTFFLPYEIIVVDNGSRDRTADLAREMGARVVTEPHQGVTWARQKGLEASRSEVLAYVDADTRVPPDWLERLWDTLDRNPRAAAVSGGVSFSKGRNWQGNLHRWSNALTLFGDKALRLVCGKTGSLWGANFAVRRNALIKAGGFNRNIQFYGDDTELSLRLRKVGRVKFEKKIVVESSPRRFERGGSLRTAGMIAWTFIRLVVTDGRWAERRRPPKHFVRRGTVSILLILVLLCLLAGAAYLAFNPSAQTYGKVLTGGPKNGEKVIALTFDDGPNEPYTSEVLDILDHNGIKATFFVIGENAEAYPETIKEIVRDGHIVGNHTYSHSYRLPFEGIIGVKKDIDRTEKVIFGLTGLRTDLFRPPHGLRTPWFVKDLKELHYSVITWTDMTNDYNLKTPPDEIVRRIIAKARPGGIIDLHDGKDVIHGIDRSNTVKALPVIIAELKDEGYRFVTLPELLHIAPYK